MVHSYQDLGQDRTFAALDVTLLATKVGQHVDALCSLVGHGQEPLEGPAFQVLKRVGEAHALCALTGEPPPLSIPACHNGGQTHSLQVCAAKLGLIN